MQIIKLSDLLGFEYEIALAPTSSLLTYAKAIPRYITSKTPLAKIGALTLANPAVKDLTLDLAFSEPFTLGNNLPILTVSAAAGAGFEVIQLTPDRKQVFEPDEYGENIPIPPGSCYVRFGLNATAAVSPGITSGSACFGAAAGSAVKIDNWRQFPAGTDAPLVTDTLAKCVAGFEFPVSADALIALRTGDIVAVTVAGTLAFSASVNLVAVANPLAAVALPDGLPVLSIVQSAAVTVGGVWTIAGEYQVRAQKTAAGRIRLGWRRKHISDFTVTASAAEGVALGTTGTTGTTDYFGTLVAAISANPAADKQALEAAGLPYAQVQAVQGAVKAAVDRKLELAMVGALGSLAEDDAAFLFEIDAGALDEAGKEAIGKALAGDLTDLLKPQAGVTEVRNIVTTVRQAHSSWRINLLGIYNFGSVSKLAIEGVVLYSDATGELVITDKATASRVSTAAVNFGAADDKLCRVLAESFLITAAYRGSRALISGPQLSSSHIFFADDRNASRDRLQAFLRDVAAIGLDGPPATAGVNSFGRTTLFIEANYNDALTESMFLNSSGGPRDAADYESVGRKSMARLVDPAAEAFRLAPLRNDALWDRMKDVGTPQFVELFGAAEAGAISADYLTIRWWADTMQHTAGILARMKAFFAANPATAPQSPEFQKLRAQLAGALKNVAGKTPDEFGAPWGLTAMYWLTGGAGAVQVRIVSPKYVFGREGGARALTV